MDDSENKNQTPWGAVGPLWSSACASTGAYGRQCGRTLETSYTIQMHGGARL